jgi:hypothetical protein
MKEISLSQPEIPPTLLLVSVENENAARVAFDQMLSLHSVALLTLNGLALISASSDGAVDVISPPENLVGLEKIVEAPTFAPLLAALKTLTAAGKKPDSIPEIASYSAGSVLGGEIRREIAGYLSPGHWTVVALASNIAEGEVNRQLDLLNAGRLSVQLSQHDAEELRSAG